MLSFPELLILGHIFAAQSADDYFPAFQDEFFPLIVQYNNAGLPDIRNILLIQHLFMVAEGKICRRDGGTCCQEGQNICLRHQR